MLGTRTPAQLGELLLRTPLFGNLSRESSAALVSRMEVDCLEQGDTLFSDAHDGHGLCLVIEGELEALENRSPRQVIRIIREGEAFDELQTLAGVDNSVTIEASTPAALAWLSGADVDDLGDTFPDIGLALERLHRRQLLTRLHTIFGTFDREFLDLVEKLADWHHLTRGEMLAEQNNEVDGIYLVISGRLRTSVIEKSGTERQLGDSCRGDVVGELSFFSGRDSAERIVAVRDSVAVGFTRTEFEQLVARRPQILSHVTRTLVLRMHSATQRTSSAGATNIAVIAITRDARIEDFSARLLDQLGRIGRTVHLTSKEVDSAMDEPGISEAWDASDQEARLLAWLDTREQNNRFVVYQADPRMSLWTRRCVRQADRIVLLANAEHDPRLSDMEKALAEAEGKSTTGAQVLVLLHRDGSKLPSGTSRWLGERKVEAHYHVRWDTAEDIGKVARSLGGKSTGLVLGGGGARGFAHIGLLKALDEAGVAIDMIAGTSMGAAVAAQYAMGWSADQLAAMFRKVYVEIRPQNEYTLPLLSLVGTGKAEMCGVMVFGDTTIEDLWTPYFCISSNLSTAKMVVHRTGLLRKATLASASLPGFVPPVLEGRELLVDGGLLNNVPTDVMRQLGCGRIIASEVSIEEDAAFTTDAIPSNWELVRGKFRRKKAPIFPSLIELAVRASLLHSTARQNEAVSDADFCFRPPIDSFGMVDFLRLDEIVKAGYDYAVNAIPELLENPAFSDHGL